MSATGSHLKKAHIAPFAIFLLLLGLGDLVTAAAKGGAGPLAMESKYWMFPLQTVVCGLLVIRYWRCYGFKAPAQTGFTFSIAILVLLAWIAPQEFFGAPLRFEGFDPAVFSKNPALYCTSLALRFVRLVVVIPLIEEIFWRGFLLRFLIREDFENIPVGAFSRMSFAIVTAGFCIEHQPADLPAALVAGVLFNLVAIRTRSLSSCVLAHAATNLLLGIYIMRTGQWGFW